MSTNFDDQFRPAFDALAERLREDIARHLNTATAELTRTAAQLAAQAEVAHATAVEQASRDAWADAERATSERLAASLAAVEARARANFHAAELLASERLAEEIRTIDAARSLTEVLSALAAAAGVEAVRAAIFLVEGPTLRSWRFVGFDPSPDANGRLEWSSTEEDVLAAAVLSGRLALADDNSLHASPPFAALPPGRPVMAAPLLLNDEVVAVLYADQGSAGDMEQESWRPILEVLARHAARALEAITAYRLVQALTDQRAASGQASLVASVLASQTSPNADEAAARRHARLLVSEIKTDHQPEIAEGIELVRTLAEGDEGLLGT